MKQLSKSKSILYHLSPGILITLGFVLWTPSMVAWGYPPQLSMLICIVLVAVPVFIIHLNRAKKDENKPTFIQLNGYGEKLPTGNLILYSLGLLVFAFLKDLRLAILTHCLLNLVGAVLSFGLLLS